MSGKFLNWWEWNSFSYSHICRRVCRGALCDLCICRREETWGRFHLVVFTQTLQFLSLFTVLPCWAIKLGAVQGKPLCSSSCIIWAGNSKANLSYGNSQVLFPLFTMWGEHMLNNYTPFLCSCTAGAAGIEVWAMVMLERRMWRKSKSECILRIDLTGEVPPAFQEDERLI